MERPLQSLKVAPPWRMILLPFGVEIIVTGDNPAQVEGQAIQILESYNKADHYHGHANAALVPLGASFEDIQKLKRELDDGHTLFPKKSD